MRLLICAAAVLAALVAAVGDPAAPVPRTSGALRHEAYVWRRAWERGWDARFGTPERAGRPRSQVGTLLDSYSDLGIDSHLPGSQRGNLALQGQASLQSTGYLNRGERPMPTHADPQPFGFFHRPGDLSLATDLYQLTMAAAYFEHGMTAQAATFELFVRHLPAERGYLVAAGLEQAIQYLTRLRFDTAARDYLRSLPVFEQVSDGFWDYLREFRFTGDLSAMPEGTIAFANEPLLQVRAPLIEAQMVETALLAIMNHQTLIATKAARVVEAAQGRTVVEFGARRAHGLEAGLHGARAAVIGGCVGTSNVLAGRVEQAEKAAVEYEDILGKDRFFLEIHDHGLEKQRKIIPDMLRIAERTGIHPVATIWTCAICAIRNGENA